MRGIRIRWAGAAKVAAIAIAALIALQALPALLKPPAPPPLAGDVGLPRVVPRDAEPEPHQILAPKRPKVDAVRKKPTQGREAVGVAAAVISSEPRRHNHVQAESSPVATQPPTPEPPSYAPPPVPVPAPPPPAPAPVSDGSEEFAPH